MFPLNNFFTDLRKPHLLHRFTRPSVRRYSPPRPIDATLEAKRREHRRRKRKLQRRARRIERMHRK